MTERFGRALVSAASARDEFLEEEPDDEDRSAEDEEQRPASRYILLTLDAGVAGKSFQRPRAPRS